MLFLDKHYLLEQGLLCIIGGYWTQNPPYLQDSSRWQPADTCELKKKGGLGVKRIGPRAISYSFCTESLVKLNSDISPQSTFCLSQKSVSLPKVASLFLPHVPSLAFTRSQKHLNSHSERSYCLISCKLILIIHGSSKHRKNCECCPVSQLIVR